VLLERDDAAVDRTPPRLIAATAVGPERVQATFSKSLDSVSACDSANYAMDGNVKVLAAEVKSNAVSVLFITRLGSTHRAWV